MSNDTESGIQPGKRVVWKIYSLLMIVSFVMGIRQGMHDDPLAWVDWTAAGVGGVALVGLIGFAWRLPGGGTNLWRAIAVAYLAVFCLGVWVMIERSASGTNVGVLVIAILLVLAIHVPEIIAVSRFSVPDEAYKFPSSVG